MTRQSTAQAVSAQQRTTSKFRPDIQGLRAIAVGLVLLYHAGVPVVTGGYVGVDVFFVISGFLISTHLLERLQRTGRIGFADFYARRIRRILPASLTVAVLTALASAVLYPPLAVERVLRDALATVLYMPNIWFAIQQTDYLADHSPSPFQHYWSLGIEEQFYLFWPVLLFAFYLLFRRRLTWIGGAVIVVTVISFAAGVVFTQTNQPVAFFALPLRAWELMVGAIVAVLLLRFHRRPPEWIGAVIGWLGLAMVAGSAVVYDSTTAFPGIAAVLPTLGTALVIGAGAEGPRWGPTKLLAIRPAQFLGEISYSLYLVHWPLLIVTQAAVGEQQPLRLIVKIALGIVLAVPLAWLLFRFVETPLRSPRALVSRRPRLTLIAALLVTLALVGVLAGTSTWASQRVTGSGDSVAGAPTFPATPPHATKFMPSNLTPSLQEVSSDVPVLYADGCHLDAGQEKVQHCRYDSGSTEIAVFGDSHSAQWFPAIHDFATQHRGIAVSAYTKSSCPAASVTVINQDVPYTSCDRWRESVLRSFEASPPDLVVISSYAYYALASHEQGAERTASWATGVAETVRRLQAAGSQVLVIADTPRFSAPPPTCVSANVLDVTKCDGDPSQVLNSVLAEAERVAVETNGGEYVNLTRYICSPKSCPVIVDDLLVYRDVNHLTTAFVRYLEPALATELRARLG